MPRTNRNTLKEYFKRGSMPNQKHFCELIDSMVNISDDGIDKNPDDGLRLAPSKDNTPVISLYTNTLDSLPEWKIFLGNNGQLHLTPLGAEEPMLSLYPNGRIEMNQPGMDIQINGSLSATRFDGAIRGRFPADGEWHTIQVPTEGCRAYRIMAGCGKLKSGQYALVEAIAMHCYGKHRKVRTNQSWFGSFFNKIRFRWQGSGQKCKLQIRSGRNYGDDIFVCFQITDLWKDSRMEMSDRRNTANKE